MDDLEVTPEGLCGGVAFPEYSGSIHVRAITYARAMLMGAAVARNDVPCTECRITKARVQAGDWHCPPQIGIVEQSLVTAS